jgi:putative restriction endonuclease
MAFRTDVLERGRLYTRPQLAQLWGYESFHAISRGVVTPKGKKVILLFVTRDKQDSLTQYRDILSEDRLEWEGERGHGSDDRIARAHERGEQILLFYRDVHHTPFRYHGEVRLTLFKRETEQPSQFAFELVHDLSPSDDLAVHADQLTGLPATEREAVVKARVGQGDFRASLVSYWGGCAVTGIARADLVRASHIKPWRFSSNEERLDRFNGLLLLPQYDHLFDRGYITFDDTGALAPSPAITSLPANRLGIDLHARISRLEAEHLPFLRYHQEEVFVARRD